VSCSMGCRRGVVLILVRKEALPIPSGTLLEPKKLWEKRDSKHMWKGLKKASGSGFNVGSLLIPSVRRNAFGGACSEGGGDFGTET